MRGSGFCKDDEGYLGPGSRHNYGTSSRHWVQSLVRNDHMPLDFFPWRGRGGASRDQKDPLKGMRHF